MNKNSLIPLFALVFSTTFGQHKYQKDFDLFWNTINEEYAYFDAKLTDWNKVKKVYNERLQSLKEDWEFTYMIELMKHELYDNHIGLNKNLAFSFRLIPNDLDACIQIKDGKYFISDIRYGYTIEDANIRIGDELVSVNGRGIVEEINWNMPAGISAPNDEVREHFANLIFAGRHNKARKVQLIRNGKTITLELPKPKSKVQSKNLLDYKVLANNIGYIKINNSLTENEVVKLFPKAVDKLMKTKALIIDLRETHSGGNTVVAKSIMGKFVTKEIPYQIHERVGVEKYFGIKRKYIELLTPLKNPYTKPVYILVSRWTGSVGEAIAQGFSNIKSATVVGTDMAKLLGAIRCQKLPTSGINFCFPFEKLYNVDGTPREEFTPDVISENYKETLDKTLKLIGEKK